LVVETGGPGENHRPVASHWQTLSHNVVLRKPHHERDSNSQLKQLNIKKTTTFEMDVLVWDRHKKMWWDKSVNWIRTLAPVCFPEYYSF
jgi:hypothetical protein